MTDLPFARRFDRCLLYWIARLAPEPPRLQRLDAERHIDSCQHRLGAEIFQFGLFQLRIQIRYSMMRKSIHTKDYSVFLQVLIDARHRSGLTQGQVGKMLPFEQPGISKIERGERRLDVIELKMICETLGISLAEFVAEFEKRLTQRK